MNEIFFLTKTEEETTSDFVKNEFERHALEAGLKIHRDSFSYVLKKEGGDIVGVLSGERTNSDAYIRNLVVAKDHRQNGFGTYLMETLTKDFRKEGVKRICLSTYRYQALGFYQKLGFAIEFVWKDLQDPRLDKIYLSKII